MKLSYDVLDPTGNITILVRTLVPEEDQPAVAARLMEAEPDAEQVGFLTQGEDCDLKLRMAGGEFCGNASMSAAVIAAEQAGESSARVRLRVSGASGVVHAKVVRQPGGEWTGTVDMPRPIAVEKAVLPDIGQIPVVRFEGISHVIIEQEMPRDKAEKLAPIWCRALGSSALGLLFLNREEASLAPLVCVPAAQTLCWENSCASGTTAVCAYLAAESEVRTVTLRQPGGTLRAQMDSDGVICLSGTVRIRKHAEMEIELS